MASTENRNQTIVRQVELLIDTAKKAEHRNTEEALSVSFEAIKLAKEHNLDRQIANCYVVIGRCYWINGDFDKAIVNFNKALDLCGEFQGDYIKVEAINGLGNVYITLERFDQALTFYNQALDIAEEQKFTILISKILNNLGTLHEELRNSQIALEYYQRSYNKSLEIEDYYGMAIADLNTGNMHFSLKNKLFHGF